MRGLALLLTLVVLAAPPLRGQVVITQSDLQAALAPGKVFTQINLAYTGTAPLRVDVGRGLSTAQVWDFSTVGSTGVDRYTSLNYTTSAGVRSPDHALFPQSNIVLNVQPRPEFEQATRSFFRLDSTSMVQRGWINRLIGSADSARAIFRIGPDGLLTLRLPVKMGAVAHYRDSTYQSEGTGSLVGSGESAVRAGTLRVDGFGTVTFPDGQTTQALRLVRDQTIYTYRPGQPRQSRRVVSVIFVSEDFEQLVFTTFTNKQSTNGAIWVESVNYTAPGYVVLGPTPPTTPTGLHLGRPWPNPASARAMVPFTLSEDGPARLTAFDLLGRRVAVLMEGPQGAGNQEVPVDVSGWAPGVYLLELQTGQARRTQMLTVVR